MSEKLHFSLPALLSMHRFGDIYADAIASVESDKVTFEVIRSARDCIGPHWYGMRVRITSKASGQTNYLHTGLIFLPETRVGLMVEVDERNNLQNYGLLVNGLQDAPEFEVNRVEKEYLKLFMPDATFADMNAQPAAAQKQILASYIKACAEAIVDCSDAMGFSLDYQDLLNAVHLGRAFREVILTGDGENFHAEINEKDPDNFGQYAMGYRYWLYNADSSVKMYAYFGAIYSYKKRPAGIFAEIDWFSNQGCFDGVKENFQACESFEYSSREEKFIKLFMPQATLDAFNAAQPEQQLVILKDFYKQCCSALSAAAH